MWGVGGMVWQGTQVLGGECVQHWVRIPTPPVTNCGSPAKAPSCTCFLNSPMGRGGGRGHYYLPAFCEGSLGQCCMKGKDVCPFSHQKF